MPPERVHVVPIGQVPHTLLLVDASTAAVHTPAEQKEPKPQSASEQHSPAHW
jgi:hypothetical protein